MANNTDRDSPLVTSVLALQNHLTELERLGGKINSIDMASDVDVDFIQKLLMRFAECGQAVSDEVTNLSTHLRRAQLQAESVAQGVSRQAEAFKTNRDEQNEHLERFRLLGERIRALNTTITQARLPQNPSGENGALTLDIPILEQQLADLVAELQSLRNSAHSSRLKTLEKSAESLAQSIQALQLRLRNLT